MPTLLLATIVIEWAVYAAVLRRDLPALFVYSTLVNCVTLPPATWIFQHLVPHLLVVEAGVVIVETVLIALLVRLPPERAFLLSLLANGTTAVLGVLFLAP